jgi:hypothetical protein
MRPLSAPLLIQAWEWGERQHIIDRALTLLTLACPEISRDKLGLLNIGHRDAYLLKIRELTFGPNLDLMVSCPNCGEVLELTVKVQELLLQEPTEPVQQDYRFSAEGFDLSFRLPNSYDLVGLLGIVNLDEARQFLAQRCLLAAIHNGTPVSFKDLPSTAIAQLSEQLSESDPQAEILLNLSCPACQHQWQALFDVVSFFWAELSAQARRLIREVHTLASLYGWREADILAMSSFKRQQYLSLMT